MDVDGFNITLSRKRKTEKLVSVKIRVLSSPNAKSLAPVQKPTGRFDDVAEGLAHGSRSVVFDAASRSAVSSISAYPI